MSESMKALEALFRNEDVTELTLTKKWEHVGHLMSNPRILRYTLEAKIRDQGKGTCAMASAFFLDDNGFEPGEEAIKCLARGVEDKLKSR